ncbi:hypothetical protein EPI10_006027 [Gossypium australe]|uniref:Uncharacterized protein n=1 Tax=Gossypium australe TaxID=47621 RepID=A0A5B6WSL7_9ROSI|nr:hypothetical protein EPI10_006027 [Gossypium australe]
MEALMEFYSYSKELKIPKKEDSNHVFRQCPTTIELWQTLNLSWVINSAITDLWEWLTWVTANSVIFSDVLHGSYGAPETSLFMRGKQQQGETCQEKFRVT